MINNYLRIGIFIKSDTYKEEYINISKFNI